MVMKSLVGSTKSFDLRLQFDLLHIKVRVSPIEEIRLIRLAMGKTLHFGKSTTQPQDLRSRSFSSRGKLLLSRGTSPSEECFHFFPIVRDRKKGRKCLILYRRHHLPKKEGYGLH